MSPGDKFCEGWVNREYTKRRQKRDAHLWALRNAVRETQRTLRVAFLEAKLAAFRKQRAEAYTPSEVTRSLSGQYSTVIHIPPICP